VLLQFVILGKQETSSTQDRNEGSDSDHGVSETWKFIKRYWKLTPPKLIISMLYDVDDSFNCLKHVDNMLWRLLTLGDPVTAEGQHFLVEINCVFVRRRGHLYMQLHGSRNTHLISSIAKAFIVVIRSSYSDFIA